MQTPYQILGISKDTGDAEIKQAYLQKVKRHPPDRDQDQFQRIHNAYNAIKDHKSRIRYQLFTPPETDFNHFIDLAFDTQQTIHLTPEHFRQLLSEGMNESTIQNTMAPSDK